MSLDYSGFDDQRGTAPARGAFSITPADGTDLAIYPKALYVGTAGDVKVDMRDGTTVTFTGAIGVLPIRVKRVYSTGTTATNILGLY
jgi:hypothetical protein